MDPLSRTDELEGQRVQPFTRTLSATESKDPPLSKGCGFNANGQVTGGIDGRTTASQAVTKVPHFNEKSVVMLAKWAYTIIGENDTALRFWLLGTGRCQRIGIEDQSGKDLEPHGQNVTLEDWTFVGNDFEPLAALNPNGDLYGFVSEPVPCFILLPKPAGTRMLCRDKSIKHIAVTETNAASILVVDTKTPDYTLVACFHTFEKLKEWYMNDQLPEHLFSTTNTSKSQGKRACSRQDYFYHRIPDKLDGLVAGATAAVAWNDTSVYTWGSAARSQELGRDPDPALGPAHIPILVSFFQGFLTKIRKVAAQGPWYVALTVSGDLYMWGRSQACTITTDDGGEPFRLSNIVEGDHAVNLVPLPDECEILDVAVGTGHMVIITESHGLYGIGDNRYFQLPMQPVSGSKIVREWSNCGTKADRVWSGPLTTFYTRTEGIQSLDRPETT